MVGESTSVTHDSDCVGEWYLRLAGEWWFFDFWGCYFVSSLQKRFPELLKRCRH